MVGRRHSHRRERSLANDDRGVSPALGAVLLVGLTVLSAAVVGAVAFGQASALSTGSAPSHVALDVSVDGSRITVVHEGGDALDAREVAVRVRVDGEPLAHQPPVPFFAAEGFVSGPTGPFNAASDPEWTAGERASLAVAGTNRPRLREGSTVTILVTQNGRTLARASTTVRDG